ncbi:MAG TPA: archaellin/type IV pilin N-terminal domain-containing protein [Thermoplasmata archaeon]|nr:archaellin/type IV pilin N-terminal domain-containing protein [Thermoplasmata archaeon]
MTTKRSAWNRLQAARARTRGRRGVSPIIATILLVAITVVLAAVLYVLISGLTSSTAAAPISLAPAITGTGGTGTTWYENIAVTPSASIATTQFGLKVASSSATVAMAAAVGGAGCTVSSAYVAGTTCTGVTPNWYAVLTNSAGTIVSIYVNGAWTVSVTITGGSFTLSVVTASQFANNGYILSAYGTGSASVSGQVHM